ncbi:hypothetical protein ACJX0J_013540, partial [Zea mays]
YFCAYMLFSLDRSRLYIILLVGLVSYSIIQLLFLYNMLIRFSIIVYISTLYRKETTNQVLFDTLNKIVGTPKYALLFQAILCPLSNFENKPWFGMRFFQEVNFQFFAGIVREYLLEIRHVPIHF